MTPHKLKKKISILVANGVNLDLLGQREPHIYGRTSPKTLEDQLQKEANRLAIYFSFEAIALELFQTNNECSYLEKISAPYDGAILNPGAWTHTSLALGDRLAALKLSFIEVHLSNLTCRKDIRQKSFCSPYAKGIVQGLGVDSYHSALFALLKSSYNA
jgi:3-dehydroquinate dehydratase-2